MRTPLQYTLGMIGSVAMGLGVLVVGLQPAAAEIRISATLSYPATAMVNTDITATLTIANVSSSTDDRQNVAVDAIFHTPSCGRNSDPECLMAVPDVFRVSNAVGRSGTACAGVQFAASPPDPISGEVQFIPDQAVVLGPAHVHGPAAQCVMDFAATVRSLPAIDSNPDAPGIQTAALASVEVGSSITYSHGDGVFSGSTEVTVAVPSCPDASRQLAAAGACTVLQSGSGNPGDDKVAFGGRGGTVGGDICIGPGSKLTAASGGSVTGGVVLDLDPPAHATAACSSSAPGVDCTKARARDLGSAIIACAALATTTSAKKCTIGDFGKSLLAIAGPARRIAGAPGENVICVKDVNLAKGEIVTLTGMASTTFVINVKNAFSINGGKILVDGTNVQPADVLYNVIGNGKPIELKGGGNDPCCEAQVDGSLVASERDISFNSARINGAVCGDGAMRFDGGSSVCAVARR